MINKLLLNGKIVSGVNFYFISEHLLTKRDSGIREFKIYQRDSTFIIKIVKKPNYEKRHGEELLEDLKSVLGKSAVLKIEFVKKIESSGTDKFKILIKEE